MVEKLSNIPMMPLVPVGHGFIIDQCKHLHIYVTSQIKLTDRQLTV